MSSTVGVLVLPGMSDSVATIIGDAVKSVRRSDANPAWTVDSYGIFPFGRAMTKTDLFALHAVTGLEDVVEIYTSCQSWNVDDARTGIPRSLSQVYFEI